MAAVRIALRPEEQDRLIVRQLIEDGNPASRQMCFTGYLFDEKKKQEMHKKKEL